MKNRLQALVAALLLSPLGVIAMPILLTDAAGQLIGANNVKVNGTTYNARFLDGSCAALFDGCNEPADFDFSTEAAAAQAAQALLDTVLIDGTGPAENYDTDPTSAYGCEDIRYCFLATPWLWDTTRSAVLVAMANNLPNEVVDHANPLVDHVNSFVKLATNGNSPSVTYVRWTVVDVPEPSSLALLGIGIVGLGWSRRRRQPCVPRC